MNKMKISELKLKNEKLVKGFRLSQLTIKKLETLAKENGVNKRMIIEYLIDEKYKETRR